MGLVASNLLTEESVANLSKTAEFPDFTSGEWTPIPALTILGE